MQQQLKFIEKARKSGSDYVILFKNIFGLYGLKGVLLLEIHLLYWGAWIKVLLADLVIKAMNNE